MAELTRTITIENINGGWINDFAKGNASSPMTKPSTYYLGTFNPNKPNYLGQVSNSFGENPNTLSATELAINATVDSIQRGYFIMRDGLIRQMDLTVTWPPVSNDYTIPTGCLNDGFKDIWKYVTPTDGFEAIFYTYQTASAAVCSYARTSSFGSTRVDPFYTFANRNVPHVGVVSVNNQSYVTDGNFLRAFDANTNTWTSVNCGIGVTLTSVADFGNFVAAVGGNGTTSWLFLWTGTAATFPNYKYEIRDTNVTSVINEGGDLRVFTFGKNGTTKIKTFNGNGFSEEGDWETPTSLCSSPTHGQVDVWLNQIVWKGSETVSGVLTDGFIWVYGSVRKDEIDKGAHRVGQLTAVSPLTANIGGCVKNLFQNNLYVGMRSGANYFIYNVKADSSYGSTTPSSLKTALYSLPRNSTIQRLMVYFSDYTVPGTASSGSSFDCSLFKDYDTTTDWLNYSIPIMDTTSASPTYYFPIVKSIPNIDTFYLDMTFSNCTIRKIDIEYTFIPGDL